MSAPSPVIARNMLEVAGVTRTFGSGRTAAQALRGVSFTVQAGQLVVLDRKSTRLNSSHPSKSRMPSSA